MIRPMTRGDREPVLGLVESTGFFRPEEVDVAAELVDIYLDQPGQKDYAIVVIEAEDGHVAGYLTWGPTPLTQGTYDLYWMAVRPGDQGRGYGRRLVRWLEDEVAGLCGRLILIETSSTARYAPTRGFYQGLDYGEIARIPDFYEPGDDRIIYMKRLSQRS